MLKDAALDSLWGNRYKVQKMTLNEEVKFFPEKEIYIIIYKEKSTIKIVNSSPVFELKSTGAIHPTCL